eukprot:6470044-Pyramimonas_sp.AAC.3
MVQQVYVQALLKVFGHAGKRKPSDSDSDSDSDSATEFAEPEEVRTKEAQKEPEIYKSPEAAKEPEEKGGEGEEATGLEEDSSKEEGDKEEGEEEGEEDMQRDVMKADEELPEGIELSEVQTKGKEEDGMEADVAQVGESLAAMNVAEDGAAETTTEAAPDAAEASPNTP